MTIQAPTLSQTQSQAVAVHRCRFVDYSPAAISAIAFPPLPLPSSSGRKKEGTAGSSRAPSRRKFGTLAVGRANGNIELCDWSGPEYENQAPQAWVLSKILYGPNPSKVDSLVFTLRHPYLHTTDEVPALSDLRLFSAGGGSELVEWDLTHGTILRTLNSQGGAIWSMAANSSNTFLALGCEDGCVRLLSLEGDSLMHHRRFDRIKCRMLSIAWGPPSPPAPKARNRQLDKDEGGGSSDSSDDDDDDEWTDSWLVTGGSDSALRKWDVSTGRVIDRMSTDKTRGERTLVWTVGVLADGTIISGDSLGIVKFWDPRTCTQLHSFQAHGADVLCLAISPDCTSVFTSGVDQKVCLFSHVSIANPDKLSKRSLRPSSRWVQSTSKRMHSHDVRALAIWPPYSCTSCSSARPSSSPAPLPGFYTGIAPVLASGGLDASLVLAPCASPSGSHVVNPLATSIASTFEDAYHRRLPYPSGLVPAVNVAHSARLVVCARDTGVSIWRIIGKARVKTELELDLQAAEAMDVDMERKVEEDCGYEKMLEMDLDATTNISASAVSDDGQWLAVADVYEVKLFELISSEGVISPKRVKTFQQLLSAHLSKSSSFAGEGASALGFSPDSTKLVIASMLSSTVFIMDLTRRDEKGRPAPQLLRKFEHHRRRDAVYKSGKGGRVVRDMPGRANGANPVALINGSTTHTDRNGDVEMDSGTDGDEGRGDGEGEDDMERENSDLNNSDEEVEEETHAIVTRMAFSPDGQWLATADDRCRTHIFNLDSVQHHTSLPTSPSTVTALAFSPSSPSSPTSTALPSLSSPVLLMSHADSTLTVYDVETRQFPEWASHLSRRENLPKRWAGLHDSVLGVFFEPSMPTPSVSPSRLPSSVTPTRESGGKKKVRAAKKAASALARKEEELSRQRHAVFWGSTWLCRVTIDAPVGWGGFLKKRRFDSSQVPSRPNLTLAPDDEEIMNFKLVTRYRPLLFADLLAAGELLVIERPLVDVLRSMPPAFFKPRYGS